MRRVVITGMGLVTPVGSTVEKFWSNIQEGKHGIREIEAFDTSEFDVKLAAEVKDFDPVDRLGKREARRMDRYCQFAVAAAQDAMADCGTDFKDLDPYRVGVITGSGIGGLTTIENEHTKYMEKGWKRLSALFIPMMISNMGAGNISIQYGFKGTNFTAVTACASSAHAIGEAYRQIKYDYLDACVSGGSEATITKFALAGFVNMGALCKSTDPDRASIPFDKERCGFVMGEGGAMLVLEELEHAKARGAKIYAEIVGCGETGDAYHITSPDPTGEGPRKAMEFALREAGVSTGEVDYINAHGTSTGPNDRTETMAVKELFGDAANKIAMSSTKSMTGHLLGAAGAVESIICALAVRDDIVPPTANFRVRDEECDLDYVTEGARKQTVDVALSNSLGFGGHNAALCFKKYQD
ncbi:beta-ketoacyl-ACP synthase II [Candidatus Soleaferrea massiliensis]|uniref:beta-ketoacyl-ACP synthase II n=1 Tax=Candidatus Soleaferrea massiliensis TaxID=1470354 RepID=UPI00058B5D7C|nr:beta-ketoacyl-ACP synthase II [Candidatus Soleaferrea massiliensis]